MQHSNWTPASTVTQSALHQPCWQERPTRTHTHTHNAVLFKSTDTISVTGDGKDSKTSKQKKKKKCWWLWWPTYDWGAAYHTDTHTPQLTCHDGHFADWTCPTRQQTCHKSCCYFSTLLLVLFHSLSLLIQLLPPENWPSVWGVGETASKHCASCKLLLSLLNCEAVPGFKEQVYCVSSSFWCIL